MEGFVTKLYLAAKKPYAGSPNNEFSPTIDFCKRWKLA